jgi:hypothetical protein
MSKTRGKMQEHSYEYLKKKEMERQLKLSQRDNSAAKKRGEIMKEEYLKQKSKGEVSNYREFLTKNKNTNVLKFTVLTPEEKKRREEARKKK